MLESPVLVLLQLPKQAGTAAQSACCSNPAGVQQAGDALPINNAYQLLTFSLLLPLMPFLFFHLTLCCSLTALLQLLPSFFSSWTDSLDELGGVSIYMYI